MSTRCDAKSASSDLTNRAIVSRSRWNRALTDSRLEIAREKANPIRATNSSTLGKPAPGGAKFGSAFIKDEESVDY